MSDEQRVFKRNPNSQGASWFLDIHSSGRLNLNPPYQRRSVWNLEYRQFFIDSVVRNYPTQSVFLDVDVDPDRPTDYKVLDGKQRLTSLIGFVKDEFPAPDSLDDLGIGGKYYSEFPKPLKARILTYVFTVESVSDVTAAELNQAFDRLNRNVSRLNKQELRHAQYGGAFISKMEHEAENPLWENVGLVTAARRRRMLDVEYVSELYIVAGRGIQDGKNYLDDIYAEFDEEIVSERETDKTFRAARKFLEAVLDTQPLAGTRLANVADFYSLWAAIVSMYRSKSLPSAEEAATRLSSFLEEIEAQTTERSRAYLLAARQGSNKSANREARALTLEAALSGE